MLIGLLALGSYADEAASKTVTDPNHKGWTGKHPRSKQMSWKPVKSKCEQCSAITQQYNDTVQELLQSRYWLNFWRQVRKNREKGKKDPFWPGKGDISDFEGKAAGANLELMEYQNAQLDLHRQQVTALEQQAQYLRQAILDCERQACQIKKPSKFKAIKIGGERTKDSWQPDVDTILQKYDVGWNGPYKTKCLPCQNMVNQLNALPGWVVRKDMQLQRAEKRLEYSRYIGKSNKVKLDFLKYAHPDKADYTELPTLVAKLKGELAALRNLFEKLVQDLEQCEQKYCPNIRPENAGLMASLIPSAQGHLLTDCPKPAAHQPITVGANKEVGSKADFKEKAKKKAADLATKAITGLLGIGGSGGGRGEGPLTYKDPVKKKQKLRVRNKQQKRDIRAGGVFTPDGLLISSDIDKAPGKGTFQTIYLENQRGWRLMPIALFMYEIWRNWKLNVSWTRDTFVDGELVKHEEGGWSESWRELIASGEEVIYGEVPTLPLWEQLGFNTAVSGARSLGTLFPVSPEMLAYEPINLVIHITDPKKDPVVTVPYVFQLSLDDRGRIVVEEVPETIATSGTPCNEPAPVIVATPPIDDSIINISDDKYPEQPAPPSCPEGWACMPGKQCPPIDNCTIVAEDITDEIEEIDVTGPRIRRIDDPVVTTPVTETPKPEPTANDDDSDLEEVIVTGSRLRRAPNDGPISIGPEDLKLEVGGPEQGPSNEPTDQTPSEDLDEVEVTGTRVGSTTGSDYQLSGGIKWDYGTRVRLGYDLKYDYGDDEDLTSTPPPTLFGEEIDPPVVGIVLKMQGLDRRWVPRHGNYTYVYSKIYVPGPGGNQWVPHPTAKRKMKITFIARSNEKGMALNKDLPSGPQDSPDLYFDSGRNPGTQCSDDPTGNGHFGTCETQSEHNEYMWRINSLDYGGFSRLDVSCEGCVQLIPVAGVFPEAFTRGQRWEVALPEPNQEKRAVYVPHDSNKNQISDGWAPDLVSSPSPDQDLEDTPTGNGVKGDGLSAYEEYRGFIDMYDLHTRTDWDRKTLLIVNGNRLDINTFGNAAGLEVVPLEVTGHRNRIINFNSGHANVVDQHGLRLKVFPSLNDKYAGYCFCDLDRPKGADWVTVKPKYSGSDTVTHELGHAVGMRHHGDPLLPAWDANIRAMTGGWRDLMPGRVHSGPSLCGVTLPASFTVGSKGDQGSGNHQCFMKYGHYHYVYKQSGGDYDCMPRTPRSIFDDSANGTGPNRGGRTADNASKGDCKSQIWISSE